MKASSFCAWHGIFIFLAALIAPALPTQYPAQAVEIFSTVGLIGGIFFAALALLFAVVEEK